MVGSSDFSNPKIRLRNSAIASAAVSFALALLLFLLFKSQFVVEGAAVLVLLHTAGLLFALTFSFAGIVSYAVFVGIGVVGYHSLEPMTVALSSILGDFVFYWWYFNRAMRLRAIRAS